MKSKIKYIDKEVLAKIYYELMVIYHQNKDLDEYAKKHIEFMIKQSFKSVHINPLKVSVEANEIANKRLSEPNTLKFADWSDQKKSIKNGGLGELNRNTDSTIFHWEHAYTCKDFVDDLLKIDIDEENAQYEIKRLLDNQQIIWITKEQNKRLDKKGYKTNRKEGWQKAYQDCGITIYNDD